MKFFFSSSHFQVKSINPFNACTNKLSISLHHLKSLFSFFFKSISIFQKINLINSFPFNYIIPPQDGKVITNEGRLFRRKDGKRWSARHRCIAKFFSTEEARSVFAIQQHSLIQRGGCFEGGKANGARNRPLLPSSSSPSSLDTRHAGPWPPQSADNT